MHASVANPAARLTDEQLAARHLLDVLGREQAHLIHADIEALISVTEEKTAAIARMTELALARHQSLAACGHAANESGMRDWVGQSAANGGSGAQWTELLDLARSAKELNRTNGLLIGTHMLRNQSAINVLHGNVPGGSFYGPDGQATARTVGRGVVVG